MPLDPAVLLVDNFMIVTPARLLQQADALARSGDLNSAVTVLRDGVSLYPAHPLLWVALAGVLCKQADPSASEVRRQAVQLSSHEPDLLVVCGQICLWQHQPRDAVDCFTAALALQPTHELALRGKARALAALNDWAEAHALQLTARSIAGGAELRPLSLEPLNALEHNSPRCTVTLISGAAFAASVGVGIYLRSVSRLTNVDRYILSAGLDESTEQSLLAMGFRVVRVKGVNAVTRDRWRAYFDLLSLTDYKECLLTDSRDVLIQCDPFDISEAASVVLSSEVDRHIDSAWNLDQQRGLQSSIGLRLDCGQWPVINAGVIRGDVDRVRDLCAVLYMTCLVGRPNSSDQAMLNFVYHTLLTTDRSVTVLDPLNTRFCVHGTSLTRRKSKLVQRCVWDRGQLYHSEYGPFAIVHQWERTDYRCDVMNQWTSRLS